MPYVVIGTRGVVTFSKGFACTREEFPREIRTHADYVARDAGLGGIGMVLRVEDYESREAAELVAACYRDGTLTIDPEIVPAVEPSRQESAGVCQATCRHEWQRSAFAGHTHWCQRCLLPGREANAR